MNLKDKLRELRPTASAQTIRTYDSVLRTLFYKAHEKDTPIDIEWFRQSDAVLDLMKDMKTQTRKTICAALVVLLDGKGEGIKDYVKTMNADADKVKGEYASQTKTKAQEENWMELSEVHEFWDKQYSHIKPILASKDEPSAAQLREMVKFMALTVACGKFFPPRRSEWVYIKLKDVDKAKDNWIDLKKSEFVFNTYKTSKYTGEERVGFPKEFKAILTKYLKKIGDSEYLLFTPAGKQVSNTGLTSMLNNVFGKKISTSLLRHIYLTDKYKDVPALAEMQKTAREMGHSVERALEYVKH